MYITFLCSTINNIKRRSAFTLAEVLIVLTIIGILASITIPAMLNNVNNQQMVAKLKKEYSVLQQAFLEVRADNGGDITYVFSSADNDAIMAAFASKLIMVKNCGGGKGCWYDSPLRTLNGSGSGSKLDTAWNGQAEKAILADGTMIRLDADSYNCNGTAGGTGTGPLANSTCGTFWIDLNGSQGPNMEGRDYFQFWITKNGIYPLGSYNDGYDCYTNGGEGCAYKVLTEGAMNY